MISAKEEALSMIQSLPDDCTNDDIYYKLYLQEKIRNGRKAIEEGRDVLQEEVERRVASWPATFGANTAR